MRQPNAGLRVARAAGILALLGLVTGCTQAPSGSVDAATSSAGSGRPVTTRAASRDPAPVAAGRWTTDRIGGGATAAAGGAGHLWVAYSRAASPAVRNTGELVEYDIETGRSEATLTVGGAPAAIAVSPGGVWVADGIGDGASPLPSGANTVLDLSTTGRLLRSVPVPNPLALATIGSTAWVYFGQGQHAVVAKLTAGASSAKDAITLPGIATGAFGTTPLLACGNQVYAVSVNPAGNRVYLSLIQAAGASTVATVQTAADAPTLACGPHGHPAMLLPSQTAAVLTGSSFRPVATGSGSLGLTAGADGALWLVYYRSGALNIEVLSDSGAPASKTLTIQTAVSTPLLVTSASALWVILPDVGHGKATLNVERVTRRL